LPASHKINIGKLRSLPTKTEVSMWSAPLPKVEARALLQMVGHNGTTVEAVRELIAIPPEIEQHFRAYTSDHPEDESAIERVIEFRRRVGEEFERLVSTRPDGLGCNAHSAAVPDSESGGDL
jgi:hypothetical protein